MTPHEEYEAALLRVRRSWPAQVAILLGFAGLLADLFIRSAVLAISLAVLFAAETAWWGSAAIRLRKAIKRCEEVRHGRA